MPKPVILKKPYGRKWRTAKLVEPIHARPIIVRLNSLGYEYQVTQSGRCLRIQVLSEDLDEVLLMLSDGDQNYDAKADLKQVKRIKYRRLFYSLPLGAAFGSGISIWLGYPSPTWAGLSALLLSLVVWQFPVSASKK